MRRCLVFISILASLLTTMVAEAQTADGDMGDSVQAPSYPAADGGRTECNAMIEMPKGSVSGICVLLHDGDTIKGAVINEFGITTLSFHYLIKKDKVKLKDVVAMLDKWYIRRVVARDLRRLLHALRDGTPQYTDGRYHITYSLSPMGRAAHGEEE